MSEVMEQPAMTLKILLPFRIFDEKDRVVRIVAETSQGSLGFLPRRLDCVAALVPGILTFETETEGETYVAVDEGILVKKGREVLVSVRNATGGDDLKVLHRVVEREFRHLDEQEQRVRLVLAKMDTVFIRNLAGFRHD